MFKEYDVPLDPDAGLPANFVQNDGSDWSLGTPSVLIPGWGVHDSWLDLSGNIWFTCNIPNKRTTIGRIDSKTGAVELFKVPAANGLAAGAHGMTRDPDGIIWFNVNPGRGGLGRLDPKTGKIDVYIPPTGMTQTGGAVTVDYDGRGNIWASAPDGALRFDPKAEKFTEYKSITWKTPGGTGITYGAAADRDGNGYWAEMILDTIGVGDGASGKVSEIKLAPVQAQQDLLTAEERKFYETYSQPDFNSPLPWAEGPRRMGTDKAADVLWIGDSWGANLARIDTHTHATTFVPLPGEQQPYHVAVDSQHDAWTNLVGRRPRHALRSEHRHMDGLRPANARRRTALCFAARARRPGHPSRAALLPCPQGRGNDAAQRGGDRRTEGAGGTVIFAVLRNLSPSPLRRGRQLQCRRN